MKELAVDVLLQARRYGADTVGPREVLLALLALEPERTMAAAERRGLDGARLALAAREWMPGAYGPGLSEVPIATGVWTLVGGAQNEESVLARLCGDAGLPEASPSERTTALLWTLRLL